MDFQQNIDLKGYTTFGISSKAARFTAVRSIDDIKMLIEEKAFQNQKVLVLGGGSNLLLTKDFDGLVIKVDIKGTEVIAEDDDTVTLKVGAGENWHELVMFAVAHNYGGIENLSLIPGTMGAAPMQNIGAYGVEIKNVVKNVEAVAINTGHVRNFTNEECMFGYRESIFKQKVKDQYVISSVSIVLTKRNHLYITNYGSVSDMLKELGHDTPTVKAISDAIIHIRRSKLPDPAKIGNAGSFFKNPSVPRELYDSLKKTHPTIPGFNSEHNLVKVPAAWLIEQCGWKGKTFNNIGVHPLQALVLVNYGGGEGAKIWELAMNIQASVKEQFNITLQPEVNVI